MQFYFSRTPWLTQRTSGARPVGTTVYSETEKRNFNPISQAELGKNFFYVALYGCRTYAQGCGDFFVGLGPCD